MKYFEINTGKWRIPQRNPWKREWVTLLKAERKTYILGTRAEAGRVKSFTLQPWSNRVNSKWIW